MYDTCFARNSVFGSDEYDTYIVTGTDELNFTNRSNLCTGVQVRMNVIS
jgi:hypothetical protein